MTSAEEPEHANDHMVHDHRAVSGGSVRAAIFGISDGLVSNVALILGVAVASVGSDPVVIAGVSGLLAGATSMAAGEYVSMKAQNELIERELDIERESLADNPQMEIRELQAIYRSRGLDKDKVRPTWAPPLPDARCLLPSLDLDPVARQPDVLRRWWPHCAAKVCLLAGNLRPRRTSKLSSLPRTCRR